MAACNTEQCNQTLVGCFLDSLIPSAHLLVHVRRTGVHRTCRWVNEIELTAAHEWLRGLFARPLCTASLRPLCGLSVGWTTTVASAVVTDIDLSFPTASGGGTTKGVRVMDTGFFSSSTRTMRPSCRGAYVQVRKRTRIGRRSWFMGRLFLPPLPTQNPKPLPIPLPIPLPLPLPKPKTQPQTPKPLPLPKTPAGTGAGTGRRARRPSGRPHRIQAGSPTSPRDTTQQHVRERYNKPSVGGFLKGFHQPAYM